MRYPFTDLVPPSDTTIMKRDAAAPPKKKEVKKPPKRPTRQINRKTGAISPGGSNATSAAGSPFPNILTRFDYRRISLKLLEETADSEPVQRSLWQLQLLAFPWCDFQLIPNTGDELDPEATKDVVPKIEEIDRRVNTALLCSQAMYDIMTYGSAIFELTWKEDDDGWVVPDVVQRLPAASFRSAPAGITTMYGVSSSNNRYIVGNLLRGIIMDKEEKDPVQAKQYWQLQDSSGAISAPVRIPSENVIHIKDAKSRYLDGSPYLMGLTSSISQLEFIRKRLMQTVSRIGAPNAIITVGVPEEYVADGAPKQLSALPGSNATRTDDMFTQLWDYAVPVAQNLSSDLATVVPKGIEVNWQKAPVPINPTEFDQYIIREITSHIFPRDAVEFLGSAISTSSEPLLDLLKLMVQGWQSMCSVPFEQYLWNEFLERNGFEGYRIELDWAPLVSPDKTKETMLVLQKFTLHVITLKEARTELGLETSDEDYATMIQELGIWKAPGGGQGGAPQQQGGDQYGSQSGGYGDYGYSDQYGSQSSGQDDYSKYLQEGNALLQKYQSKFKGL